MAVEVAQTDVVRKTVGYHPSVWGDYFLTHISNDEMVKIWSEEAESLKQEVRRMLKGDPTDQHLKQIDAIQRLAIAHIFEEEIEEILQEIYKAAPDCYEQEEDLYTATLRFRLLRQQGFNVSSDVLKKFKDVDGNFNSNIVKDARAVLSLHEAAHLSVRGETILDEALEFTRNHLQSMVDQLSSPLSDQVKHALKWPTWRGHPRKEAYIYFSMYQQQENCNQTLLKLAKLDFNIAQNFYQKDLKFLTKWWEDLDIKNNLPYVRDRVVESFFYGVGMFPAPEMGYARRVLTKSICVICIIDDFYDAFGTFDENELFTKAVDRLDISAKEELPSNIMQLAFQSILDFCAEVEEETTKEGRPFCIHYMKEAMRTQTRLYMEEARWLKKGYVPSFEEYMSVAAPSIAYPFLIFISLCGMGSVASKEVFDWLCDEPKIFHVGANISRLFDDMKSHKFEQEREHISSAVECYMKQHGVSQEETYLVLNKLKENYWKDLNEELMKLKGHIPSPILRCIFDLVRAVHAVYKDTDIFTHPTDEFNDVLTALLVNPVVV